MDSRIFRYINYDKMIEEGENKIDEKRNLTMIFYDLIMDMTFTATPGDYNRFSMAIPIAKKIDGELICFNRNITLKDYFSDIEIYLGKVAFEDKGLNMLAEELSEKLKHKDLLKEICENFSYDVDTCIEEYCRYIN